MENKQKCHTACRNSSKIKQKIRRQGQKRHLQHTCVQDRSLSQLGTDTSIRKSGGVVLALLSQTLSLSEMMRSCKCFPHVSKM